MLVRILLVLLEKVIADRVVRVAKACFRSELPTLTSAPVPPGCIQDRELGMGVRAEIICVSGGRVVERMCRGGVIRPRRGR